MVRLMSSKAFRGGDKNYQRCHYLVDKLMNTCESYSTKSYSKMSRASSCRCMGIAKCLIYNPERVKPIFLGKTLVIKCGLDFNNRS